ncbi:cytochrome c oxidase subunit 3 family protein [Magnetococcus sp. PR-3]|uniref:cytochrome c oxidase subunit 3 family protein n=1 Tax=Magnetococcus sp. PR-3 TaxID=3120355 RepID=UPI002FCE585A
MSSQSSVTTMERSPYPPGDLAVWMLIAMELLTFGIFFCVYTFMRAKQPELFDASQQLLNRQAGAINTLLLITSSFFVVRGVEAIKQGASRVCGHWLAATLSMGVGFLLVKVWEYGQKYAAGITPDTDQFFFFYFALTAFHAFHVIMGMVILSFIMFKAYRGGYSSENHMGVESGASFWHMVDLVWIILFPLIYVMR